MFKRIVACFATLVVVLGMLALLNLAEPIMTDVQANPDPPRIETYRVTPQRELTLHIYEPANASETELHAKTNRPAIVFFFGGGWLSGGPGHFAGQSRALAERGIVAICPAYRTHDPDGTTPIDALVDALHAVAWVRDHAESLGINPTRIAVGGGSAGGHLAAACATVPDAKIAELTPELPASPRPDALVLFNPVLDNGPATAGREAGYGHDRIGDDYVWFSPAHNVRPGLPPTLIMLGTADHLVPVAVVTEFRDAMVANGDTCDVELYRGQAHGFFNRHPGKEAMYDSTLKRSIYFLREHGWIKGSANTRPD
ncbi:MAG: alpha/beta hydrolase [Planctomycetota bacterium]